MKITFNGIFIKLCLETNKINKKQFFQTKHYFDNSLLGLSYLLQVMDITKMESYFMDFSYLMHLIYGIMKSQAAN